MATPLRSKWKSAFKQIVKPTTKETRIKVSCKDLTTTEIKYLENIMDPDFDVDTLIVNNNFNAALIKNLNFLRSFIITTVDSGIVERAVFGIEVLMENVKEEILDSETAQRLFFLSLERAVDSNDDNILKALIELVRDQDLFEATVENLPALLKACNNQQAQLVETLISNGYLLSKHIVYCSKYLVEN